MWNNGGMGPDYRKIFKSHHDHGTDHDCPLKVIGGRIKVNFWAYNYRLKSVSGLKIFSLGLFLGISFSGNCVLSSSYAGLGKRIRNSIPIVADVRLLFNCYNVCFPRAVLRSLEATQNQLEELPEQLGLLANLELLYLRHNRLTRLPLLRSCTKLKVLGRLDSLKISSLRNLG